MIVSYAQLNNEAQQWLRRLAATTRMKNETSQLGRYLLFNVPKGKCSKYLLIMPFVVSEEGLEYFLY